MMSWQASIKSRHSQVSLCSKLDNPSLSDTLRKILISNLCLLSSTFTLKYSFLEEVAHLTQVLPSNGWQKYSLNFTIKALKISVSILRALSASFWSLLSPPPRLSRMSSSSSTQSTTGRSKEAQSTNLCGSMQPLRNSGLRSSVMTATIRSSF